MKRYMKVVVSVVGGTLVAGVASGVNIVPVPGEDLRDLAFSATGSNLVVEDPGTFHGWLYQPNRGRWRGYGNYPAGGSVDPSVYTHKFEKSVRDRYGQSVRTQCVPFLGDANEWKVGCTIQTVTFPFGRTVSTGGMEFGRESVYVNVATRRVYFGWGALGR